MTRALLYTKLFGSESHEFIRDSAKELGFDGIDLLVRDGSSVPVEKIDEIPEVAADARAHGLEVPLVTCDFTDPARQPIDHLFGACASAGVEAVRLGYWYYDASTPVAVQQEMARRNLDAIEPIARRHGIRATIQLHGGTLHASGAMTRVLLDGREPEIFGSYPDPCNQAVQGGSEDWPLTFDLLRPWLYCLGVKNGGLFPSSVDPAGGRAWRIEWLPLSEGLAPWHEILPPLGRELGDALTVSLHSHYEMPLPQVLAQTRADLHYVRGLLGAAS